MIIYVFVFVLFCCFFLQWKSIKYCEFNSDTCTCEHKGVRLHVHLLKPGQTTKYQHSSSVGDMDFWHHFYVHPIRLIIDQHCQLLIVLCQILLATRETGIALLLMKWLHLCLTNSTTPVSRNLGQNSQWLAMPVPLVLFSTHENGGPL